MKSTPRSQLASQVKNLQIELKGPTEWSEFPIKNLHIYIKYPYVLSFI